MTNADHWRKECAHWRKEASHWRRVAKRWEAQAQAWQEVYEVTTGGEDPEPPEPEERPVAEVVSIKGGAN